MRIFLVFVVIFVCCATLHASPDVLQDNLMGTLLRNAPGLNPEVLKSALKANACAAKQRIINSNQILTVIDYSLPSSKKRLWTFDLKAERVLFNEFVAHGKNSGENETTAVSNADGSLMTSVGVYLTANPYIGKNGYSLRLVGLEKGFNDNVLSRAVVLHGAWYVSDEMIQNYGRQIAMKEHCR